MSNTDSSTQEIISEENDQDNTQEMKEEDDEGNSQEINEEDDQGKTQDQEIKEEQDEEEDAKKIYNMFKEDNNVSEIILTGKAGTGKTWVAMQIRKYVVNVKHDEPIWIPLDKKHDALSLFDTIARQFSLRTNTDAREEIETDQKKEVSEKEKMELSAKKLKDDMKKKLKEAAAAQKFLLVVLDGEFDLLLTDDEKKEEVKVENSVKEILGLGSLKDDPNLKYVKFLITRRSKDEDSSQGVKKLKLGPLPENEAIRLLQKNYVVRKVKDSSYSQEFTQLSEAIRNKKLLPAEVLMLAGTLNYIAENQSKDLKMDLAFEAAIDDLKQLLRYTYDKEPANCMINCFWHSWHFLQKHGGVHYNELITNWIMEGHLKPIKEIDKAYQKGHHILMQLIDCHMLKMQEDNVVVLEGATLNMNEYCRRGNLGRADPGLASVLKDYDPRVLEGIRPADGMMKTLCSDSKEEMISSLLVDGGRLCREVHGTFFGGKHNLNLLSIFDGRLKSPNELSISEMKKLLALILRGAYLLKNIDQIANLNALTVLEISGSTFLKEIPDQLFQEVSKLRSLKLSALGITSLPKSFSELIELRRLILSKCSSLEQLPKVDKFTKLEVIDLSECKSLVKIQEKSFKSLEKLQVINFSHTKIEKLPIVKTLQHLEILLLKGCADLVGMRSLKNVSTLKVLDLSGAENIKEIMYDSFEGTSNLKELDLSGTKIQFLPSDISHLQKLKLSGCSLLIELPELDGCDILEELDLSDCKILKKLPDLSALQKLKNLNLQNCSSLESLPDLTSLTKLVKLDLSGTTLWSEDVEKSLKDHIPRLEIQK
ncbi:hypothetical protein CCACVL1_24743 [Corchorus capsularis]|uniref:NB-ARC domain-containing protein n=1 Tax=Corchorus capsularis TaxID=210143 RepID=A0A1R3GN93_COCAP|nr:hypothetical protein CCACVL1_24743 [Corchorus capsularis]